MTNQAGDSEDDSKPHSKDQRMTLSFNDMEERRPVEITTMVSSDKRHIGSGAHSARKDTVRLTPIEEPKVQNASSQGQPNSIGAIAKRKLNAAKREPKAHKMPAMDRNIESLTSEEIARFQSPSQRR
jgi:hypothetical protein